MAALVTLGVFVNLDIVSTSMTINVHLLFSHLAVMASVHGPPRSPPAPSTFFSTTETSRLSAVGRRSLASRNSLIWILPMTPTSLR